MRFLLQAWSALEVAVIEKGWRIHEDNIEDAAPMMRTIPHGRNNKSW
jgi:hypothetical protein